MVSSARVVRYASKYVAAPCNKHEISLNIRRLNLKRVSKPLSSRGVLLLLSADLRFINIPLQLYLADMPYTVSLSSYEVQSQYCCRGFHWSSYCTSRPPSFAAIATQLPHNTIIALPLRRKGKKLAGRMYDIAFGPPFAAGALDLGDRSVHYDPPTTWLFRVSYLFVQTRRQVSDRSMYFVEWFCWTTFRDLALNRERPSLQAEWIGRCPISDYRAGRLA